MDAFAAMHQLLGSLPAEVRRRIVSQYEASLRELGGRLDELLARGDSPDARLVVHKLAGSAAMMQDPGLADHLRATERALLEDSFAFARQSWMRARAAMSRSHEQLARWR